jgi:5'-deoxynucleotidase
MVRTQRDQTLAEHLYLVTMYADEIARNVMDEYSDSDRLKLLSWCLEHDTPEILTGDIPTPAKRRMQEKFGDSDILEELEDSIASDNYKKSKKAVYGTKLEIITKLADIMDGIAFINLEGFSDHSKVIGDKLKASFYKVICKGKTEYPDDNWDAAGKVLDDVMHGQDGQIEFESDY